MEIGGSVSAIGRDLLCSVKPNKHKHREQDLDPGEMGGTITWDEPPDSVQPAKHMEYSGMAR